MSENDTAYSYQAPDQNIYDLLMGSRGRFGLMPQVEAYYRSQLENLGGPDTNPFTYTGERIAGFSPREEYAMELADQGIGAYAPYLSRAKGLTEEALATMAGGSAEAKAALLRAQQQGEDYTRTGLQQGTDFLGRSIDKTSEAEQGLMGRLGQAEGSFREAEREGLDYASEAERIAREGQAITDPFYKEGIAGVREGREAEISGLSAADQAARRGVSAQSPYLEEALQQTRASTAGFDPSSVSSYMDPYEDAVVQQTIKDIQKGQSQSDIARRASEIGSGAFGGSRSRLGQEESDIAANRGMMEAVGALRSQGYQSARDAAMGEFGRARAAEAGAAGMTAGLGAQAGGAESGLAQLLAGTAGQRGSAYRGSGAEIAGLGGAMGGSRERLAGTVGALGSQRSGYRSGLGTNLSNIGQTGYGAKMGTAGALSGAGSELYGMGTGAGRQFYDMGAGASSGLAGLAGQLSGAQTGAAGAYQGLAGAEQGFRQGDIGSMMNIGAMNRARNQAGLDLNYQNFVGQYNMPQQLMSGYANFLTGAGPLAGGTGYSGTTQATPFSGYGTATGSNFSYPAYGMQDGGRVIPQGNKGLAALSRKAPEVVRKMGFTPAKKNMGGVVNPRFPMASRKLGA